ncbi:hypothetical protein ACSBR2_036779 [Camellia fascicularis]
MLDNGDPKDWAKCHKKIEVSRKGLLQLDHDTKLKVLWQFINNSHPLSDYDDDHHTHSVFADREGSKKNGVVSPCSVVIDVVDDDNGDDGERSPFGNFVVIPKGKRSEHCNKKNFVIVPVNHMSEAEATMTKKPMKIRCKLKPPDKSFVSKRRLSDGDYGDDEEKVRRKKKRMIVKAPAKFKNHIESLNGTELNFVIEKPLYKTDLNHNHRRLSLPLSQIDNGFLTREEKDLLETRIENHKTSIEAKLIDPSSQESNIFLKKCDMPKKTGKVNSTYNLMTSWNDVVESNRLCEGMIVQLWSFWVDSKLWFTLVEVMKI